MSYCEHPAVDALRPLVECAWTFTTDQEKQLPTEQLILPDGCVDLIVDLRKPGAFVVGAMTVAQEVTLYDPVDFVAVRFAPGGAFPLLGVPLRELTDRSVDLSELRHDVDGILDALQGKRASEAADVLQRELAVRPQQAPAPPPWWGALVRQLTSDEALGVGEVSARLGLSRQHVARRCNALAGLTPRQLVRIARLRRLLRLVDEGEPGGWAGLAVAAGYYDQPHMIGEMKVLTGRTPCQLHPGV